MDDRGDFQAAAHAAIAELTGDGWECYFHRHGAEHGWTFTKVVLTGGGYVQLRGEGDTACEAADDARRCRDGVAGTPGGTAAVPSVPRIAR